MNMKSMRKPAQFWKKKSPAIKFLRDFEMNMRNPLAAARFRFAKGFFLFDLR